jgi:hypothetical protein
VVFIYTMVSALLSGLRALTEDPLRMSAAHVRYVRYACLPRCEHVILPLTSIQFILHIDFCQRGKQDGRTRVLV